MRESDGGAGNVFMILFHTRVFRALYLPTPFPRGLGEFYPRVSTGRARITLEPRFADADLAVEAQIQGPGAANGEREVSMTRQLSFEPLLCTLIELPLVWLREAVLQNSLLASSLEIFSQFHREGGALCL